MQPCTQVVHSLLPPLIPSPQTLIIARTGSRLVWCSHPLLRPTHRCFQQPCHPRRLWTSRLKVQLSEALATGQPPRDGAYQTGSVAAVVTLNPAHKTLQLDSRSQAHRSMTLAPAYSQGPHHSSQGAGQLVARYSLFPSACAKFHNIIETYQTHYVVMEATQRASLL